MANATPDLRLPSHAQDIAALRVVLNYTVGGEGTCVCMCEELAQGRYLTAKRPGVELATSPVASQRHNHYTTSATHRTRSESYRSANLKLRCCVVMRIILMKMVYRHCQRLRACNLI